MILTGILQKTTKPRLSLKQCLHNSKREAIRYLKYFEEAGDLNAAVVISLPDQEKDVMPLMKSQKHGKKIWDDMMEKYGNEENYEEYNKDEFVNGDEIDLLIVVDNLLTGLMHQGLLLCI